MTPEMIKLRRRCEILEAIAAGGMVGDMAKRLGIHTSTFYAALKDHGIGHDMQRDLRLGGDIKALQLLASRGFSSVDIAAILQRSKLWVQATAKEGGVKLPRGRLAHMPSRRALLAVVSGRTVDQAAGALKVSRATVCAWMKAEGIGLQERNEFARANFGEAVPDVAAGGLEAELKPVRKAAASLPRVRVVGQLGCSAAAINKAMEKHRGARHAG